MPERIRASAPGKLVLTGEYAVLDGAPALSMAIDRRATVTLAPARHYRLSAPGLLTAPVEFTPDGAGGLRWSGLAPETRRQLALFESITAPLLHEHSHQPFEAELDTRAFFADGTKLGFGSSAALATSLNAALIRYLGLPEPCLAELWTKLVERHSSAQQGRGSGIDIATALRGGIIEFRRHADGRSVRNSVRNVALPDGLHWLCVWSGSAVSTGDFLARIARWRASEPPAAEAVMSDLADRARLAAAALADTSAFLRAVEKFAAALDRMGQAAGVDVVSTAHRRIAAIAATHGAVYKPSGAGGGDAGIALSNDASLLERLASALEEENFHCPAVAASSEGLVVHE